MTNRLSNSFDFKLILRIKVNNWHNFVLVGEFLFFYLSNLFEIEFLSNINWRCIHEIERI